jgi:hypothetical protein
MTIGLPSILYYSSFELEHLEEHGGSRNEKGLFRGSRFKLYSFSDGHRDLVYTELPLSL